MKNKIELIKSLFLLLLICLLVFLIGQTWVYGLQFSDVPQNSWIGQLMDYFKDPENQEATMVDVRILPDSMVVRGTKGTYAIEYSDGLLDPYHLISPLFPTLAKPLSVPVQVEEADLVSALQSLSITLGYTGFMSLGQIGAENGDDWSLQNREIRSFCVAPIKEQIFVFFREAQSGHIYRYPTQLSISDFLQAVDQFPPTGHTLAADMPSVPTLPEFILSPSALSFSKIRITNPDSLSYEQIIAAFAYNPYTTKRYLEGDTQVFVENFSTLRIAQNGYIVFEASDLKGGVAAYDPATVSYSFEEISRIRLAKNIATAAMNSGIGSIEVSASYQDAKTGNYIISLFLRVDGVKASEGEYFARFEFVDNLLISCAIQVKKYERSPEKSFVLPPKQAVSLLQQGKTHDLRLIYSPVVDSDMEYFPQWKIVHRKEVTP